MECLQVALVAVAVRFNFLKQIDGNALCRPIYNPCRPAEWMRQYIHVGIIFRINNALALPFRQDYV